MQDLGAEAMGNPEKKLKQLLQVEVARKELKVRVLDGMKYFYTRNCNELPESSQ
jgi:hypothetical protein